MRTAFGTYVVDPNSSPEGENILAAIWLSIPRKSKYLGGKDVLTWLVGSKNRVRDKVPMVFFYGKGDTQAASAASALFNDLKRAGREKLELTGTRDKEGKFAGVDLLGKESLKTEEDITGYLTQRVMARGARTSVPQRPDQGPPFSLVPLQQFGFNLR